METEMEIIRCANHWCRALHKIGSYCASCLLCMHEVMIIPFLHAHELCYLVIIVMCLGLLSEGYMYMYESVLLPLLLYCAL